MILYLVAIAFATATVFAGIPTACNNGNREHLRNGHEPNAGVAFAPDLIVAVIIWCGGAKLFGHFFGGAVALWLVVGCGSLILFLTIRRARLSTSEYHRFVDDNGYREVVERHKQKAQQVGSSNGG
jgi:hypothetical protein